MASFRNISDQVCINAYGYSFMRDAVEVTEDSLVTKFRKYSTLEEVTGKAPQVAEETAEADTLDRDALKAKADELGIEYFARIKTEALAKLVSEAE